MATNLNLNTTDVDWPFGTEFAEELLKVITLLSHRTIKKVESVSFTAYWAGTVLRIDIPQAEIT